MIRANVANLKSSVPRKVLCSERDIFPKPRQDNPGVYGVSPEYYDIAGLRIIAGRFFDKDDNDRRAAGLCSG